MSKKKEEKKVEILEKSQELEQDTKLNEEMLKVEEELQRLTEENNDLVEKVKYHQAELINYRKRKDEEVSNTLKYANQSLILELLPIVDNFERALKQNTNEEFSKYLEGFKMMYANLVQVLKNFGVEEINRVGEVFDPNLEQALVTDKVDEKED